MIFIHRYPQIPTHLNMVLFRGLENWQKAVTKNWSATTHTRLSIEAN